MPTARHWRSFDHARRFIPESLCGSLIQHPYSEKPRYLLGLAGRTRLSARSFPKFR
jgi:hypothetical protein